MKLAKANVDIGLWSPVLSEDGYPLAFYYEIIRDWHKATVTEDQWNVFVSDFNNKVVRRNMVCIETNRSELILDNNPNITEIDPVVIFTKLRQLDVHRTKIRDLSPLGELARRAPLLTFLDLSYTLISSIEHL